MASDCESASSGSLLGLSRRMQHATSWLLRRPPLASSTSSASFDHSPSEEASPPPPVLTTWHAKSEASTSEKFSVIRCELVSADSDASTSAADFLRSSSCDSTKSGFSGTSRESEDSVDSGPSSEELASHEHTLAAGQSTGESSEGSITQQVPVTVSLSTQAHVDNSAPASAAVSAGRAECTDVLAELSRMASKRANELLRESALQKDDQRLRDDVNRQLERYRSAHAGFQKSVAKLMSAQEGLQAASQKFEAMSEIALRLTRIRS